MDVERWETEGVQMDAPEGIWSLPALAFGHSLWQLLGQARTVSAPCASMSLSVTEV